MPFGIGVFVSGVGAPVAVTSNTALAIVPWGCGPVSSTCVVAPGATWICPPTASSMIEPELL